MIHSWRIVHTDYMASAFDGEGARLTGGRWNSEGTPIVYTAGSLSLALLEMIVHLEIKNLLNYFKVIPVQFSASLVQTVPLEELSPFWNAAPPLYSSKHIGDQWTQENRSVVLCIPSAVVPNELNYLLNPQHPEFSKISIGDPLDLPLDARIVSKLK